MSNLDFKFEFDRRNKSIIVEIFLILIKKMFFILYKNRVSYLKREYKNLELFQFDQTLA